MLWNGELCSPSVKSQRVSASRDSTRGHQVPHTFSLLLSFKCSILNKSHFKKPQHRISVLFYTRKTNIPLYGHCILGFLTAWKIHNKPNVLKTPQNYSFMVFVVHIVVIDLGCRCPHYHFNTIDGSKCPSSPHSCLRGTISSVPSFSLFWITNPVTQHRHYKDL